MDALTPRLAVAETLIAHPSSQTRGWWPQAATWLIRIELEERLLLLLAKHGVNATGISTRAQLLVLRSKDKQAERQIAPTWYALSRAAHHHAYELAPTAAELRGWLDTVGKIGADEATKA